MRFAVLLCLAVVACGCGGGGGTDRPNEDATLLLDFAPNAVHAGIYLATERDYDGAEGVNLKVRAPGASTDALKLLEAGRVDMAILDIHDLALARENGAHIVGVMALVQQPLASLLAQPGIRRPRDLEGKRAGVSGLPSDVAVLRSIVQGDGGDPDKVKTTTIGFQAVKALLAKRVDAATAFWNVEGVALQAERPATQEFRVDQFGAPAYPELVLCATRRTLDEQRPVLQATVRALQRGYNETQVDPESAISALQQANPDLDRNAAAAQLDAVSPAFTAGADVYGQLREDVLQKWAAWDLEFGIVKKPIDVGASFDRGLAQP